MGGTAIRTMVSDAGRKRWLVDFLTVGTSLLISQIAMAQLGPLNISGYLEYQYRLTAAEESPSADTHLGTIRSDLSTYLWRPWILQVNASLGLTKSFNESPTSLGDGELNQESTLLTGRLRLDLFRQSRFPFNAYVNRQDSRVEGDLPGNELLSTTYGFYQQYAAKGGGRYSVQYQRILAESIVADDLTEFREDTSDDWIFQAQESLGSNQFEYKSTFTNVSRISSKQTLDRDSHTLQHRLNTSGGFFVDDTLFFSDERFEFADTATDRRFAQLISVSTWRPNTDRPLLVTGRALLQGTETGNAGMEQRSKNLALTAAATYQYSDRVLFAANAGVTEVDAPGEENDLSTVFQRLLADYRSPDFDIWAGQYRWSGTVDLGNTVGRDEDISENSVKDIALRFNHRIVRQKALRSGRNFQIGLAQDVAGLADTAGNERQAFSHSIHATLSNYTGRTSSYLQLSSSDRRNRGDDKGFFQLVNLQASRNSRLGRDRDWSGSVTVQYGRSFRPDDGAEASDEKSVSYSADLRYRHADLFDVSNLNFTAELRMRSSDFLSDDPLDVITVQPDRERTDIDWRNRLTYWIGLLEFRLDANMRQIDDKWSALLFLSVRRHYGIG
jgi:hypothetical protein